MNKHDNGFQGIRPLAYGDVWDKMSSTERRSAFYSDLLVGFGGAALIYWNPIIGFGTIGTLGLYFVFRILWKMRKEI